MVIQNALWKVGSILGWFAQQQRCILVAVLLLFVALFSLIVVELVGGNHSYPRQVSNRAAGNGNAKEK